MEHRIYVVEDEALIAMELEDHIRKFGYIVCGHAARSEVAMREIPRANPDLVLLDINLGPGLNGLDIAEALREHVDVPIIFLTAYSDLRLVERAAKTCSSAYLVKPFHPQELRANIAMALCRHASEREVREADKRTRANAEALRIRSRELERALSLQQATLDAISEGVLVLDPGAAGANRQFFAMWGLEGLATPPVDEVLIELVRARLIDPDALLREQATPTEHDLLELRDGRVFERRVRLRIVDGEPVGRLLSFRDITTERRAETHLWERKARLRQVVEHISDGLLVELPEGQITFVNDRFAAMHATTKERVRERRFEDFVDPAWRSVMRSRCPIPAADRNTATRFTYLGLRGDGDTFWAEADFVSICAPDGTLTGIQTTLRDITERKETEEALRVLSTGVALLRGDALLSELARQLARLLQVSVGFVGVVSPSGQGIRTVALWVDDEQASTTAVDLSLLPLDAGDDDALTDAALATPGVWQDISDVDVEDATLALLVDSKGRKLGVLGILSRTPLRRPRRVRALLGLFAVLAGAKIEQQREEKRFRYLFEFSPDAVLIAARSGEIIMANRCAHALFGLEESGGGLVGKTVDEFVPEEHRAHHVDRRRRFYEDARPRPMGSLGQALGLRRADGTVIPVDISLGPLRAGGEELVIVSIRDLSVHKRAEERRASLELQLRQAQKMEALGTLAGGIAHDFNNVLGAIVGNTDLARTVLDEGHRAHLFIDAVGVAAERATLLVRQILAFSRQQAPQRTRTSLGPIVEEVERLLRATLSARISLEVDVSADSPLVFVDVTQIHQVLMNLGTNASHAITAATGIIEIRLDRVDGNARITVRDTGAGMDAETLDRALEPFFTTKPIGRGTGLGLSVVHGIILDHDGELMIESSPGEGTTVTILLPEDDSGNVVPRQRPEVLTVPLSGVGIRILLVDDDLLVATVGEAMLKDLGYDVTALTDPSAALMTVAAAPHCYDIVFTDCNMPTLSGIELAREFAAIQPALPVILVSGHTGFSDAEITAAGIRFRLNKPYTLRALDQVLRIVREDAGMAERARRA